MRFPSLVCCNLLAQVIVIASISFPANSADNSCEALIKNYAKEDFPVYRVADITVKLPYGKSSFFKSAPIEIETLNFPYYSLGEHRFLSFANAEDKRLLSCNSGCDIISISMSKAYRKDDTAYQINAFNALSRGDKIPDLSLVRRFNSLNDKKLTSEWRVLPDRKSILECDPTTLPNPGCTITSDYSHLVTIEAYFNRRYLPEYAKIFEYVTNIINCLSREG